MTSTMLPQQPTSGDHEPGHPQQPRSIRLVRRRTTPWRLSAVGVVPSRATTVDEFVTRTPTDESFFRAVILFGRNVASYKFALGRSLIDLARQERESVSLEDLAVPFSRYLTDHLRLVDTQGTSKSSRFLDMCRSYNAGDVGVDQLQGGTARLGFVNVIDAFHVVGDGDVPVRFFVDERQQNGGIRLTDRLHDMVHSEQAPNLPLEIEARWRLVESSWALNIPAKALQVAFEPDGDLLVVRLARSNS